jgi:Zn-dependent protease with chaperone function
LVAVLGRAAWRAWQRSNAVAAIVALARQPSERLASAGRRAGVEVRLLPVADRECFVAGIARPIAYISAGALECLTDAELDATLRHERSHIVGHDTALLAGICFLGDLVPSGKTALTAYLQSRERTADEQAVLSSEPVVLASALLTLARKQRQPLPAIAMAGTVAPAWRLKAILDFEEAADQGYGGFAGLAALAFTVVWVAWPTAQNYIIDHFCTCHL